MNPSLKKAVLAIAAVSAVATALPAAAQGRGGWTPIEVRLERLQDRIQRGVQTGDLTRPEAQRIRAEFRDLVGRERTYSRDGLNRREQADLNARFERLSARVRYERRDENTRDDRGHNRRGY